MTTPTPPPGFEIVNTEPVPAMPPPPPGFVVQQPPASGSFTSGGITGWFGRAEDEPIDFAGPDMEVRAAIRKLPKEQQKAAGRKWAEARAARERAGEGTLGAIGNGVRAVARGTFVGPWLDEAQAGVSSLAHMATGGRIGKEYDESVELQRAHDRAFDKDNPYLSTALKVGGGLAGGLGSLAVRGSSLAARGAMSLVGGPLAAVTPAAGAIGRVGQGIGVGAIHGASYGAGEAEGGFDAPGLASRAGGAAEGALWGGAMGGAFSPVMDVATGAARMAFKPAKERAEDLFALAATRDGPPGMDPAASLRLYGDRADRLTGISPSVRLADAGGENVGNMMRLATNVPNDMRETVRKVADVRAAHQWKRLEDAMLKEGMDGMVLPSGASAASAPQHFYQGAEAMAAKLDQIGAQRIQPTLKTPTPLTPQLAEVLSRDPMKPILKRVEAAFSAEGRTLEGLKAFPGKTPVGGTEFMFRLKLELDDMINQTQQAVKMGNTPQAGHDLRALVTLKKDLLDNIQNPAFKAGLKEYAGEAQLLTALKSGKDEFKDLQPAQIKARLAELRKQSPQAETFWRIGALREMVEQIRMGNRMNDRTKGLLGSPNMELKLKALMPNEEAYRRFMRVVAAERKMAFTRHKLQGNSTTFAQFSEGQEASKVAENIVTAGRVVNNLAHGNVASAIGNVMSRAADGYARRAQGITPAVASELLKIGMSRDPRTLQSILSRPSTPVPDARTAIINALMSATAGAR